MKTKHTVIAFVAGIVITGLGLALKMAHLPLANIFLVSGIVVEIIGGILFVFKLFTCPKDKNLMDW